MPKADVYKVEAGGASAQQLAKCIYHCTVVFAAEHYIWLVRPQFGVANIRDLRSRTTTNSLFREILHDYAAQAPALMAKPVRS